MIMNEHQKETTFLSHIIRYDDSDEGRKLQQSIAQVQRDQCCVQRVASVMALFPALALAGVAYEIVLQNNFPYDGPHRGLRLLCEVGLASLISLMAFAGLLMGYRVKLKRLRDQCRRLVTHVLESRLGTPHPTPPPRVHREPDHSQT